MLQQKTMGKNFKTNHVLLRLAAFFVLSHFCTPSIAQDNGDSKITVFASNAPLRSVFKKIEKQTNFRFTYSENELNTNEKVTVRFSNVPLNSVLHDILVPIGVEWRYIDKNIYLRKEVKTKKENTSIRPTQINSGAPTVNISGKVTDADGVPLQGVTIIVKGTSVGTITDNNGGFSFDAIDSNSILAISYIGYDKEEVSVNSSRVNNGKHLNIMLRLVTGSLDETVVKGYYITSKRFNTGSITKVKGEDIAKQPVSDPMMALEGRVSGLQITQASGMPGANVKVSLRGKNSIENGNDPLYIVDGIPFTSISLSNKYITGGAVGTPPGDGVGLSPFNNLNSSDIESIEVLKDADATSIYGSRGANGVILITTKKGKAGKTKFDFNIYSGAGKVTNMLNLLNTQQYLEMRHEAFNNDGITPGTGDYDINGTWDTTRYTDWQKLLIGGTAKFTNVQGALSGGNEFTQFLISGGYSNQSTVFPGDYSDQKASVHFNLTHSSSNQRLNAVFSASFINDNNRLPSIDFTKNISLAPDAPALYDRRGNLNWEDNTFSNPFAMLLRSAKSITNNLISNFNISYRILPDLVVKSSFGYSQIEMNQSIITPLSSYDPSRSAQLFRRRNDFGTSDIKTWIIEPQVNYIKQIGKGKLDVLIGSTFQQDTKNYLGQMASGFASDGQIKNIGAAGSVSLAGVDYSQYKYNAIFGRINYNLNGKYLVNLTARRDGSSRFGSGNQFGNFGALGLGWIFSSEDFLKNSLPVLSFGKLRASYGSTGNDQIKDYQYLATYSTYPYPYEGLSGLYPTRIPNPYFSWELVKKLEFGLEFGFLKDRFFFTTNIYRNRTGNQLVGYSLPYYAGFPSVQANLPATVQNSGLEFEFNSSNFKTTEFVWTTSVNISFPRNKLIAYSNLEGSSNKNTYVIGQSIFIQKYLNYTGLDSKTGLYTFEDVNKDNQITNPDDFTTIKQISQKYFGGLQNSLSYKGIQLDIFIQFVKQNGRTPLGLFNSTPGYVNQNGPTEILQRWRKTGDITDIQPFSTGIGAFDQARSNYLRSNASVVDVSYIRFKNLSLSYTLPPSWIEKAHFRNARIYLQVQNLLTITGYKGLDPETQGLTLPPLRMITAGVQFGL
jgi:TonB-linked SusC/RagA family outer membrane protein